MDDINKIIWCYFLDILNDEDIIKEEEVKTLESKDILAKIFIHFVDLIKEKLTREQVIKNASTNKIFNPKYINENTLESNYMTFVSHYYPNVKELDIIEDEEYMKAFKYCIVELYYSLSLQIRDWTEIGRPTYKDPGDAEKINEEGLPTINMLYSSYKYYGDNREKILQRS